MPNNCNERDGEQCERDSKCKLFNDNCIELEKPNDRSINFDYDTDEWYLWWWIIYL